MTNWLESDDAIEDFYISLPAMKLKTDAPFKRGTTLSMNIDLRVRSVRVEEGRKGDTTGVMVLVLEDATVVHVETPEQRRARYEAEEASNQSAVIQEHPGIEDIGEGVEHPADGTMSAEVSNEITDEEWAAMTEEQRAEVRRQSVLDGDAEVPGEKLLVGEVVQEEFVDATPRQAGGPIVVDDADQYAGVDF